ncbi:helix-turn-helix domain-containing protein [Collimonas sp.]|jgi:AcrR family transcriptional regulator|uniref:TetR/AcrR family transcriptional regulator n=1 Tax=Collimonas sp. TaxID=1963772 RepID=UPI002B98E8D1|nr:helix-turn-helix domain-containing protein [Collimonas sp.]HWW03688.1 helix-turn-helix domain-containing protein [Collimonas sp.]
MSDIKQKSETVLEPGDRRSRRTRHDLDSALTKLLQRRSYDAIRVSDIVKKAEVGRATFYAHFDNKDELLRKQLGDVMNRLVSVSANLPGLLDATALFVHLRQAPQMYQSLMRGTTAPGVVRMAQEILEQRLTTALSASAEPPASLHARFISTSLFTVLAWWSENGMQQSPAELQTIFSGLFSSQA